MAKYGLPVLLVFFTLSSAVGAICWPYTINTWLVFLGKPSHIVWWQGALLGFAPWIGQASVPLAIFTWIIMLFLA